MEIVDVRYLGSDGQYQEYSPSDLSLINKSLITPNFGGPSDYVEYFIKDQGNEVLSSNYYNTKYEIGSNLNPVTGTTTVLYLDPETDARAAGYDRGVVNLKYNFYRKQLLSSPTPQQSFWIKEISTTRTEIKVARQDLSNTQLADAFSRFNAQLAADAYYPDFLLNFGADVQLIGINAVYVEEAGSGYIIFKLYEPLPATFDIKSTFWVVTEVANSAEFNVSINVEPEVLRDSFQIRGPNFKVQINDKVSQTTPYYDYASLFATTVTSSFQQLKSMMDEKAIQINVDYGDFSDFIHYSSVTERLYNFVYKLQLIESASAGIATTNTNSAKVILQAQIDSIITKFDGYEYYLYYQSQSAAWPKLNKTQPYVVASVTSSLAVNWLGSPTTLPTATVRSMYYSASNYDNQNKDLLQYTTPAYIRDDSNNQPYLVFLDMILQHFDNICIYVKDITNRYSAENNPFVGISMDQVADALRGLGIQLYTNTSISDNIYYSLLGINANGGLLPPTGSEVITNYVTSSIATLPSTQITNEYYKRLYHNLSYLLKTRGTERGIKALITCYGIPSDILTVNEYGGYNIYTTPGIQEIADNKIITGSVLQISSSLLYPNTTIQYYDNSYDKSSVDLEIGFSPADSINASITSSGYVTASNQPGYFNIMQLIGAPNLQYSSSYTPLDLVSNTYFNAEYTSRYNVWDFIRIIKYYNNSLFKMLKDFVPARSSALTGIIIKSHMLERNKYPRHEPTATTSSYDADYYLLAVSGSDGGAVNGSTAYVQAIPIQYNYTASAALSGSPGIVYMSSSDDVQKYNGEFAGSVIQGAYETFTQVDISSYAYPQTSSVAPSSNGGVDKMFLTYSLSPLFQNITASTLSQRFLDLDYNQSQLAPVNYGLVTQSIDRSQIIGAVSQSVQPYSQYAQLQDYNYNYRASVLFKYSGSQLVGRYYNTYSLSDISYGSDPVINYYSSKLGLFTQITTSSFFPGKVNATLAYLADVSGGLFELNQNNKHWEDVQNIFKAGTTLTIKQFDNKKYTNQKATDGVKPIYSSGYSYTPQLYYVSGADDRLYFQYTGESTAGDFTAANGGSPNFYISGATSPRYAVSLTDSSLRSGDIYYGFDNQISDPNSEFNPGTATVFASFTASQAAQKTFTANFDVNFEFQDPSTNPTGSGSFSFGVYQNGTSLIGTLQTVDFTSSYTPGGITTGSIGTLTPDPTPDATPIFNSVFRQLKGPFRYYIDNALQSGILGDANSQLTASYYTWTQGSSPQSGILIQSATGDLFQPLGPLRPFNSLSPSLIDNTIAQSGGTIIIGTSIYTSTQTINYTTPATSFAIGDKAVFKLTQGGMSTSNYTASLSAGSLVANTVSVGAGGYPYATASAANAGWFIDSITDLGLQSDIVFSSNLSQYTGYLFVPYFESGSTVYSSSLYSTYGDVNTTFLPQTGDKMVMFDNAGVVQDVDILSITTGSNLTVTVVPEVLSNWTIKPSLITRVLILRKYQDEQNVILTFNKNPGATSYGFTIPETINPNVTANINTLQAAVQSQLLSTQASTNQ